MEKEAELAALGEAETLGQVEKEASAEMCPKEFQSWERVAFFILFFHFQGVIKGKRQGELLAGFNFRGSDVARAQIRVRSLLLSLCTAPNHPMLPPYPRRMSTFAVSSTLLKMCICVLGCKVATEVNDWRQQVLSLKSGIFIQKHSFTVTLSQLDIFY